MNREEAQNLLNNSRPKGNNAYSIMLNEALNMAIKALEQEPCDNAVSRQDVLDLAKKGILVSNGNYESVCKAINELPSVNPQPCEDAIDRAEAIKIASGYCHPANVAKELANLPPVNLMLCEDAISREDALMCLTGEIKETDTIETIIARIVRRIRKLPPVNPTKTGHWIVDRDDSRRWDKVRFYCSECGKWQTYGKTDYCPSCGAKMIEPQERSDKE